jgi:hypothetical protein
VRDVLGTEAEKEVSKKKLKIFELFITCMIPCDESTVSAIFLIKLAAFAAYGPQGRRPRFGDLSIRAPRPT